RRSPSPPSPAGSRQRPRLPSRHKREERRVVSWFRCSRTPVAVLEAHHVIQFRCRHLRDVGVFHGFHTVNHSRRNVKCLAGTQRQLASLAVLFNSQPQLPTDNIECFFFHFVVLQTERLAAIDMKNLAGIAISMTEDNLVTPRLRYALNLALPEEMIV